MNLDNFYLILIDMVYVIIGICTFIIFLILICILLRKYSAKNFEYRRYFSQEGAFAGSRIYLVEEFTNRSFLPVFRATVETHITSKLDIAGSAGGNEINRLFLSRFFVMPYTRIRRRHAIICRQRGIYRLESAKVSFMGIEVYLESRAKLMVYPRELEYAAKNYIVTAAKMTDISRYPLIRDPFSFSGIREYANGDMMNMINHKATAKTGRLMVNENEFVMGRKLHLFINFQPGNTGISVDRFESLMERAMEYCAYLAGRACENGWEIGFGANCRMDGGENYVDIKNGSGKAVYMEIMESMARARTLYGLSFGHLLAKSLDGGIFGSEVIIFTTWVDGFTDEMTAALERRNNSVEIVMLRP